MIAQFSILSEDFEFKRPELSKSSEYAVKDGQICMKIYQAFRLEYTVSHFILYADDNNNDDKTYGNGTQITNMYNKNRKNCVSYEIQHQNYDVE